MEQWAFFSSKTFVQQPCLEQLNFTVIDAYKRVYCAALQRSRLWCLNHSFTVFSYSTFECWKVCYNEDLAVSSVSMAEKTNYRMLITVIKTKNRKSFCEVESAFSCANPLRNGSAGKSTT